MAQVQHLKYLQLAKCVTAWKANIVRGDGFLNKESLIVRLCLATALSRQQEEQRLASSMLAL